MISTLSDLRLAIRGLRRSPLFAAVAILSLALGIGANTAIFTLIDQILLAEAAGAAAPEQLVMLYQQGRNMGSNMGVADALVSALPGPAAEGGAAGGGAVPPPGRRRRSSVDNQTERVEAEMVSGNYFSMLGVKPALGRVFNSQEDDQVYQGHPVVVLSYGYWVSRFARDPGRRRQEDSRQRLPDDDRRRVGRRDSRGSIRRSRRRFACRS